MTLFPVILSLCDRTGNWARPYAEAGYRVVTVDMQECAEPYRNRHHLTGDARLLSLDDLAAFDVRPGEVLALLAAPPCTYFASSGARWERTPAQMAEALSVVDACLRWVRMLQPKWWALENPVGTLGCYIGPPAAYFDPCDYGDPYTKRTCLWGSFTMPPMTPVEPTEGSKMHLLPPQRRAGQSTQCHPHGLRPRLLRGEPLRNHPKCGRKLPPRRRDNPSLPRCTGDTRCRPTTRCAPPPSTPGGPLLAAATSTRTAMPRLSTPSTPSWTRRLGARTERPLSPH